MFWFGRARSLTGTDGTGVEQAWVTTWEVWDMGRMGRRRRMGMGAMGRMGLGCVDGMASRAAWERSWDVVVVA